MVRISKNEKPLEKLLSSALIIWVRNQCDYIGDIKIELNIESLIDLIRGRLSGARLIAKEIIFKNLPIHSAECNTGEIEVKLDLKRNKVTLSKDFRMEGIISFTNKGLNDLLLADKWAWLGNYLSEELLGASEFINIAIENYIKK